MQLAEDMGIKVERRPIPEEELKHLKKLVLVVLPQ